MYGGGSLISVQLFKIFVVACEVTTWCRVTDCIVVVGLKAEMNVPLGLDKWNCVDVGHTHT